MLSKVTPALWLLLVAGAASAQVEVGAEAGAKVAVGERGKRHEPCGKRGGKRCFPGSMAVYAPFDFRVGRWDLRGTTRSYQPTQFTVGMNPDVTIFSHGYTNRSRVVANLGGGNSGTEWNLGGIWTFGGRLSLGQAQQGGLFGRVGLDGYLGGNSDFYHSHLELPRFELGYQLFSNSSLFVEAAGRGGLMLAGRHRVFDRTRDIGFSASIGGYLTLQMQYLRVQVDALRVLEGAHEPKTPIDRAEADLCGLLGSLALCATASSERAEVSNGQGIKTHADFIGLKLAGVNASLSNR